MLTTDEYGKVSVFFTWVQVFGIIAMFCLSYGVFNSGMVDYPDKRKSYSFSMLVLSNIITIITFALICFLYPFVKKYIGVSFPLIVLMFILFLFQPAYNFWSCHQRYEYNYKPILKWSIISTLISPIISIIVIFLFPKGNRLYPRLFGGEIPLIIIYIGFYIYLAVENKGKCDKSFWRGALIFNIPLIPHYLSTYLLGSADRLMISYLIDDSATAYYSVAYSVAAVASIVWTAVNSTLIPYTYQKCKNKEYKDINAITMPILMVFFCCCVLVIMLAPEVVKLMATSEYLEAIYVIPPIVAGVFFQVQYFVYANIVYYYKKPKYVMIGSVSAVLLNILLNYIFIKRFGFIAAGFTTLLCYIVQALIDYFAMKKIVRQDIYNMKYILLMSIMIIIVGLLSILTYDGFIIRYFVIAALVSLTYLFRKKIKVIVHQLMTKKNDE